MKHTFLGQNRKENKYIPNTLVLVMGEFEIMQYTANSILIKRTNGEGMEINLDTLRKIWGKYY